MTGRGYHRHNADLARDHAMTQAARAARLAARASGATLDEADHAGAVAACDTETAILRAVHSVLHAPVRPPPPNGDIPDPPSPAKRVRR